MNKDTLLDLRNELDIILKGAGVKPDQISKLGKRLDKMSEEKGKKTMTIDVLKELFRPVFSEEKFLKAIQKIKIENEVVVNPPQIIVKATDPTLVNELVKKLAIVLKGSIKQEIIVQPPKVEVKERELKIPKIFQVLGIRGLAKFLKDLITFWKAIDHKNPLPVILSYQGKGYGATAKGGKGGVDAIIGGPSRIYVRNKDNNTADLIESATSLDVYNVTLVAANTEYSQVLPSRTRKFKIYALQADKKTPLRDVLKYKLGIAASGNDWSAVDHIPIPAGGYDQQDGLKLTGKTLYFQSPVTGIVIIEAWT